MGVGSCTAIFSIVNAVLIRSLPYRNADRLVNVFTPNPHMKIAPIEAFSPSFGDFFDVKREMLSFASMSAFEPAAFSSVDEKISIRVGGASVDGSFFRLFNHRLRLAAQSSRQMISPGTTMWL